MTAAYAVSSYSYKQLYSVNEIEAVANDVKEVNILLFVKFCAFRLRSMNPFCGWISPMGFNLGCFFCEGPPTTFFDTIRRCTLENVALIYDVHAGGSPLGLKPFIAKDKALIEKGAAHRHRASALYGNIFDLISVPVRCTFALYPVTLVYKRCQP
jgi:hypothetical protein